MKILYFYQYFSTPKGAWGTRVYEFAKEWVEQGHEVTVVTGIYAKSDLKAEKLVETQFFDGIKVKVINVSINNKHSIPKRILGFLLYSAIATYYALKTRADLVVASSGPITVGLPGLIARWIRGKKLVFETRDLWPEGAIELGVIKNPFIIKISRFLEKFCYRSSSLIVALSPGMRDHIIRNHEHKNVISVTNAANLDLFDPSKANPDLIDLPPRTYAIYTGNIGEVNNSYWLYEAAKVLKGKDREDIIILIIGDGQQKDELKKLAAQNQVTNLVFKELMPKTQLVQYVLNAQVSLVPLKGLPILDTSSPNKFFESLAAGVPIIQNTKGWMKEFLDQHDVGYTIDPNVPGNLADMLIKLDEQDGDHMRARAREVAIKNFDQKILAEKYLASLKVLTHGG